MGIDPEIANSLPITGPIPGRPCPLEGSPVKGAAHYRANLRKGLPIRRSLAGSPCRVSGHRRGAYENSREARFTNHLAIAGRRRSSTTS